MRGDEPRWERIERIFAAALELDVVGLDAFIARECGDDHVLAAQVRELLAADAELRQGAASGFLEELDPVRAVALLDDVDEPGPGTMLGRYRIIRRLARGGNGVVYHAEDPGLRRPVALKLLSLHMGADDRAGRRLVNEARAASALDHPNIATVYEVGRTTDGQPFIAMAYYDGDTLRARIARGPLSGNETIDIATQVAEGLAAAHGKGIVHRDIKPENLVLGADGRVRILDFGIAQVATPDKSAARGTFGTIAYMSPEQTRGDDTDARTDVWALGVVLHEMLAGRRPFADADTRVLIDRIRGEEATPLRRAAPDAAPELEAIVARCLEKVPDRRFADGAALARALRQLPGRSRPARGTRRVAVAVALYATVAAGIAWLVLTAAGGLPRITAANGADAGESIARVVLTDHASADGDDADIAIALREALRVDLQQSGFVEVLTRTETASLLQRMSMPDSTRIDLPVARELAQRGGAGAVVSLTVSRLGPQYILSGRAVDPVTGRELFAARTAAGERRLLAGVEKLSREMRRGLGEERESIRRSRPLPNVTTSSLEALKLYAEADRLLTSDYDAAESYVAEALRVDTAFAMAHRLAGAITGSQLRVGEATYHLTRAWELRDRLTDRESRHVDALYHASVTLQPRQAATAYEMLLHRYPDDWRAANNLAGLAQAWLNDHDTARTLFLRATELNPNAPIAFQNAIPAAFLAGYLPQADSLAGVAADRGYAAIADRWLLVRAFATGDYSDAARRCDDVLTPPMRLPALAEELEFCGSVDIATGRLRRGVERLENVRRSHEAAGRTRNAAHAVQSIAVAHLLGNDDDAAARVIRAFVDGVTARDVAEPDRFITRINLQVQAALMDRPDLVRTIAEAYPPYPDAQHWFRRAGVGLVNAALSVGAGDPEAALRTLRSEWPAELDAIGWRIWLELISGIAHERAGRPDSAVVHYERAADPRYHALMTLTKNRIYLPITLQRLAAAHTMRGDPRAAVVAQRRLLELWSDADADLAPQMAALRDAVTAGTADHTAGANH